MKEVCIAASMNTSSHKEQVWMVSLGLLIIPLCWCALIDVAGQQHSVPPPAPEPYPEQYQEINPLPPPHHHAVTDKPSDCKPQ